MRVVEAVEVGDVPVVEVGVVLACGGLGGLGSGGGSIRFGGVFYPCIKSVL